MLDKVRQNKGGLITWTFLGAIIVVFIVSFGPGSYDKGCAPAAPTWAARVNGVTLPASEFEREYENLLRFYQQFGQAPTREMAAQIGLPGQALDRIVDRELVVQEAAREGIVVSDAEISRTVHEMGAFQSGGRFDFDLYERIARNVAGSPAKYEALLRKDLLYQRMTQALRQTVKVSEAEVRQAWSDEQDRASLTYVAFPLAAAQAAAKPTDAEVAAFADREAARVEQFYKENPARFEQKQRAHVRHLLVRVPETADAAAEAAARAKVDAAAARVAKGEAFEKVAAEVSEDAATKDKGGDLGFVSPELVDPAFADAAFKLSAGQVSAPIRTPSGWHLVQAIAVEPARTTSLAEARLEIARDLLAREKGRALAQQRAQAALDAAKAGRSLSDLFPAKNPQKLGDQALTASDTASFRAADASVPGLAGATGLREDAFAAAAGQPLPRVYETPEALVVAVVKSRERPDPALYASQRATVAERLEGKREAAVLQAWTAELAKKATIKRNPVYLEAVSAAR
ncbi:MAG TPA: SurA N-terminal domain-containing protein [Anaeromyxobacteraceae bacterium]|nr:SurA N-terminal domain-containing protein [Anaeromyxobacteraceae bacterium]